MPSEVGAMARTAEDRKKRTTHAATLADRHLERYKLLMLLNRHSVAVVEILNFFTYDGAISDRESNYFRLMIEEVRALSSQCILEALDGREVETSAKASKRRLELEKRLFGN
jgi:hypothetical protein